VDGDIITISTPHELQEAFEQFMTHPSNTGVTPVVLRVQVTFVKEQKCVAQKRLQRKFTANVVMQKMTEDNPEDESSEDKSSGEKFSKDKFMQNLDTNKRGRNGGKWVQLKHALESLVTNMAETVEKMANDCDNGKKTNLEMQAVLDSLVTNMKATVEKLSEDMEVMQSRKKIGVSIDEVVGTCATGKPFNRMNGRKRKNLKIQGMLDSFVTDMTETIQKLSDLAEEKSGNDVDNTSLPSKDKVLNSEETKTTTPDADAYDYYCSVVGSSEPVTKDVAEVIMAKRAIAAKDVGKAENVISTSNPSSSGNDRTSWEVVP